MDEYGNRRKRKGRKNGEGSSENENGGKAKVKKKAKRKIDQGRYYNISKIRYNDQYSDDDSSSSVNNE